MKKILVFLTILFLTACGNGTTSSLEEFDHSLLKDELKSETFQSELPAKMPFEVDSASFEPAPGRQRDTLQTFQFNGVDGEFMDLKTSRGEVHFSEIEDSEEVEIVDKKGAFGKTENGSLSLHWKDGNLTYHLMAKGDEVSKEELVETAESFE